MKRAMGQLLRLMHIIMEKKHVHRFKDVPTCCAVSLVDIMAGYLEVGMHQILTLPQTAIKTKVSPGHEVLLLLCNHSSPPVPYWVIC